MKNLLGLSKYFEKIINFHFRLLINITLLVVILLSNSHTRIKAKAIKRSDYQKIRPGTDYLSQFGYLSYSNSGSGSLISINSLTNALKEFQRNAAIPVTGQLDNKTLETMKLPRCGVKDTFHNKRGKRYVRGTSQWYHQDLTYRIRNYSPDLSQFDIESAISQAFKVWSDTTHFRFRKVYEQYADIDIKFTSGYHQDGSAFDGPGIILAHAFHPGVGIGGDIHFDEDETWYHIPNGSVELIGVNLFSTTVHEIGHSLGLAHSSDMNAIMFPFYKSYGKSVTLGIDDLEAIGDLYGLDYLPNKPKTSSSPRSTSKQAYSTKSPVKIPTTKATTIKSSPSETKTVKSSPTMGATVTSSTLPPVIIVPSKGSLPNLCTSSVDAASIIRGDVFIFKGKWFWRFDHLHGKYDGYPYLVTKFWYGLPQDITHIDAIYERADGNIIVFIDKRFWLLSGSGLAYGAPKNGYPLTKLGFSNSVKKIDTAFIWGYNQATYFMSGDKYWKYNEQFNQMELGYPFSRNNYWNGIPINVDAAMQYWDGYTYFFHNQKYYRFSDARSEVDKSYPKHIGKFFGCSEEEFDDFEERYDKTYEANSSNENILHFILYIIHLFISYLYYFDRHFNSH